MRVFIDSDVVISSLLSSRGAAYMLLNATDVTRILSTTSLKELRVVCRRLNIAGSQLETLIQKRFSVLPIQEKTPRDYRKYVTDPKDAHIVAGAAVARATYLISYNLKHFKAEKIRNDLNILLMTPALFLQYMRSH